MAALYDRLKGFVGGGETGDEADAGPSSPLQGPQALVALLLPLGAVALIVALRQRSGPAAAQDVASTAKRAVSTAKDAAVGAARKRPKPKNLVRYYGIGVLISALERDSSRKVLLTGLKWMQRRA
jgi:hypothetical protein